MLELSEAGIQEARQFRDVVRGRVLQGGCSSMHKGYRIAQWPLNSFTSSAALQPQEHPPFQITHSETSLREGLSRWYPCVHIMFMIASCCCPFPLWLSLCANGHPQKPSVGIWRYAQAAKSLLCKYEDLILDSQHLWKSKYSCAHL